MIPYETTSDPSYAEVAATGELLASPISTETAHQVLEALFQVGRENQPELRLLMAQNSPMPDLFVNIRRWAIRPTADVDSEPRLFSSLPSTAVMPETITTALLANMQWAIRPTADVDSEPRLFSSLPSTAVMPETITTALLANMQWAIRPTADVDSEPRLFSSLPSTAAMPETIITTLRLCGLDAIADRLSYLHRLVEDDQNEQSINIDSLRELALFFLSERQLGNPQIGINPDGLAQVEWSVGERGTLAMVFLPSGFTRFAAISAPAQRGVERKRVSGTLSKSETMDAIRPFTDRIASP